MRQRKLGNTGLTVSEIGMGTWELGGREWGDISETDAVDLLRYAFESGVTYYDTADQYGGGRAEQLLGEAFSALGNRVVIATKLGYELDSDGWISQGWEHPAFNVSPDYIRSAVEGSLTRLKRDVIDIYQFHGPPPASAWDDAFGTMEDLKIEGKIRFYGMGLGSEADALKAIAGTGISSLMLTYNILTQEMATPVMETAAEKGVAIVVRQPLSSGLLSGQLGPDTVFAENDYRKTWSREKFLADLERVKQVKSIIGDKARSLPQASLNFILAHPAVSCVVPGMMTPAQVDDGVATSGTAPLPATVLDQLRDN
ncbi:aldo/keto reductase [Candidatus Poribacteria bacterium]|nr:aldo/keto reductase [Candidatus Poribacteria bacterium]MYB01848.1 aldo/keto reductase [Candidatus Poribacteria bacterium]